MNEKPSGAPVRPVLPTLLTSKEVAAALQVSSATLSRWRQTGHGPRVVWLTPYAPRYRPEDVEAWLSRSAA
jgi:predicted DNA-binding transcriptional regulator AlpA